jgi:hypothetical protein
MYREIVDWSTSKISAQISSVMLLRAYPLATMSASRRVSSRGRPFPYPMVLRGIGPRSPPARRVAQRSSPDIRPNRNGFSVVKGFGVETSFLSAGEAVARYLMRRVARFLRTSGIDPRTSDNRSFA